MLLVVFVVLALLRVTVLLLLLPLGQSLRVRNLLCAMQMRVVRVTSSDVQFALA